MLRLGDFGLGGTSPLDQPLADVVREQNVFEAAQLEGTLVGFRFTAYMAGVNAGGWHFHFVDEARRLGGHVLDVRAGLLLAALDETRVLTLVLPDDTAFESADLTGGDASFGAAVRPAVIHSAVPATAGTASASATPAPSTAGATSSAPDPDDGLY